MRMENGANLADNITGCDPPNGLDKLAHGAVPVALVVEVIAVLLVNVRDGLTRVLQALRLGEIQSNGIH